MVQPWIFTSPASRGIGLQLTRRLLQTTNLPIVATARTDLVGTKTRILDGLDVDPQRLEVLQLDVTGTIQRPQPITPPLKDHSPTPDESTISAAASHCATRFKNSYLHLAFCIPGILHPEKSPSQISYPDALETLKINTLGPLLLTKHFSPFLPRKSTPLSPASANPSLPAQAVFALMSARVGSISDNSLGGWYSYRASKAGVNQLAKSLDIYLRNSAGDKAVAVALHPGTVKTGLSEEFWKSTRPEKLFSAEFAAERLCEVVRGVGMQGRGKCWDWEGKEIPP